MKEAQMKNPNCLGHYHRDIINVLIKGRYTVTVLLSCNHTKVVSKHYYSKYKDHATLCLVCTQNKGGVTNG